MCPNAEQLLGTLKNLGYGPDKVVPIAFHVDYFNKPWKDRFSDPAYSQREMAYNGAQKREDLYFTPMLMVDGRYPMLGSDKTKALAALRRATADGASATIDAEWKTDASNPGKKTLRVTTEALGSVAAGREVMVGVALHEDPVTTKVESGENEGKTLVERYAVRKFLWKKFTLTRGRPELSTFPLELAADWDVSKLGVAVWVQDWNDGRVFQADAIPWAEPVPITKASR